MKADIKKANKIDKQVARWDLYAKIAPTVFLLGCFVSLSYGISSFNTLFNVGMVLFAMTAVVWWFWTIFTVRFIVKTMSNATKELIEVKEELAAIKDELREQ